MNKKNNILIDCDPGIDDALAVLFALNDSSLKIKAITTESGNVGVDQTTKNLIGILKLAGLKEFPEIGKGSPVPLEGKNIEARPVHGDDGLGNTNLNPKKPSLKIRDGVDLIVSLVESGEVDKIVATAPLTNLAMAFEKNPGIAKKIKALYIMGGALRVPGNVTGFAEFNFFCDAKAAKIVLASKVPITLVSLDVTQRPILKEKTLDSFKAIKGRLSGFIQHIAKYSIEYHKEYRGTDGAFIHDPLTVGLAIDENLAEYEMLSLDVKTGGEEKGKLFVKSGKPNVRFARSIDYNGFLSIFLKRLQKLCKEVPN